MKFTGVVLIVITILFAIGLRLAETGEQSGGMSPETEPRIKFVDDQAQCAIVVVEREGDRPKRVTVDLECYGRRVEVP